MNADLTIEKPAEKKKTDQQELISAFYAMGDEKIMEAKTFTLKQSAGKMEWNIQVDGEYV